MRFTWMTRVWMGVGLFGASLAAGVAAPSCTSDPTPADVVTLPPRPCTDGTYVLASCLASSYDGTAPERFSDEACRTLVDVEARAAVPHDDARAPRITTPAEGAVVPRDAPYTFVWQPTGIARTRRGCAPTWASHAVEGGGSAGFAWPSLIAEAEAHCPPFSGTGYAAVFRANGQEIVRVETASTTWTPNADAWARLIAARGTIEMRVLAMRFSTNNIVEGPVDQSAPRRFTIAP